MSTYGKRWPSADDEGQVMNVLEFATLVVTGFIACAGFGSYAFVHPVIRRLPATAHLQVEQGLLRTFRRVMPVGMTLCVVLAITSATASDGDPRLWHWLSAAAFVLALISTIIFTCRSIWPPGSGMRRTHPLSGSRLVTSGSSSRPCVPGCC